MLRRRLKERDGIDPDDVIMSPDAAAARAILEYACGTQRLSDAPTRLFAFSDDKALIGERYPLGSEELEALRRQTTPADFSDLAKPEWSPVGTNTLAGGLSYFSDSQWTNHPARFYRLRSP